MKRIALLSLFALMSFATCSSSNSSEAPQQTDKGSFVTLRGKVQNPQNGQISIQELKDAGGAGWSDTIMLKKDNTFEKKVKVSEPGYYRLNFYNIQVVNLILYKNDLEVNVDGGSMSGLSEVKGSPEIDFVREAQAVIQGVEGSPEAMKIN